MWNGIERRTVDREQTLERRTVKREQTLSGVILERKPRKINTDDIVIFVATTAIASAFVVLVLLFT